MATTAPAYGTLESHAGRRRLKPAKRRVVVHAVSLTPADIAALVEQTTDVDVVVIRTDWLTPQDAAAYLQVGEDLIKDAFAHGLEFADLGYRTLRTRKLWVDRYAESRRRRHAAAVEERDERAVQVP